MNFEEKWHWEINVGITKNKKKNKNNYTNKLVCLKRMFIQAFDNINIV